MMKLIKTVALIFLMLLSLESFCQTGAAPEMADILRRDGKIYTVVIGLVIILTAMIILLVRLDRKVSTLEKQVGKDQ